MALLIAIGGFVVSVGLFVHWLTVGNYVAAATLFVAFATATAGCIRDYRRGKWSILSGTLIGLWMLLTVGALVFAIWIEHERG